ncbi:unnamed protein product [Durusdinium trenchii]|uniref:Uncharacterized protein n=2 Tax=Durusdinium trenchii TaxID=1381693 RepID=A0ABP0P2B9_9DINO
MILDVRLSAIGKATEVQLNTLRRKLGVGCDPCYDYSGRQEVQRSAEDNEENICSPEDLHQDRVLGFSDLLRQVNMAKSETLEMRHVSEDIPHKAGYDRKNHEEKRPSSAFRSCGRDLQKHCQKAQGPTVGSYSPKAECLASLGRVKHPTPKVPDFKAYLSHLTSPAPYENIEHEDQLLSVDNQGSMRQMTFVNMAKQTPRPAMSTLPPNDPEALDPKGVLDGHLKCARFGHFYRQPCFEFGKFGRRELAAPGGNASLGDYDVKLHTVKPGIRCHSFSSIPRADFASKRITDHLPDRSLARDCGCLTRFGKLVSPPVTVPKFDRPKRPQKPVPMIAEHKTDEGTLGVERQWAWPSREAPKALGISVNHESNTFGQGSLAQLRPTSAPAR